VKIQQIFDKHEYFSLNSILLGGTPDMSKTAGESAEDTENSTPSRSIPLKNRDGYYCPRERVL
jgi:hypothetical protein